MSRKEDLERDLRSWNRILGFPPVTPEWMAKKLDEAGVDPELFTRQRKLPTSQQGEDNDESTNHV